MNLIADIVGRATLGPNNIMLLSSGRNYGVRRSLPHVFGLVFGYLSMFF